MVTVDQRWMKRHHATFPAKQWQATIQMVFCTETGDQLNWREGRRLPRLQLADGAEVLKMDDKQHSEMQSGFT